MSYLERLEVYQGTVNWYSDRKGFGSLRDMSGEEVQFAKSQLNGAVRKGTSVTFQVAYDWDRNLFGINVTPQSNK